MLLLYILIIPPPSRVCSFLCVQVPVHTEARGPPQGSFLRSCAPCVGDRNLTGSCGLPIRLGWLAISLQGPSVSVSHTYSVSSF